MLYRQIIYKYVSEHYLDLKDWTITIYSTNKKSNIKEFMTDNNNINVKIPHGITGLKSVKIYIQDKSDFGLIVLMNTLVICHELAHAVEDNYGHEIYSDDRIESEYNGKKKKLFGLLAHRGFRLPKKLFFDESYVDELDHLLYTQHVLLF